MSEMVEMKLSEDEDGGVVIPLTRGQVALIDRSDLELVSSYRWTAHLNRGKWYAMHRNQKKECVVRLQMHRLLMNPTVFQVVDHIDGNTLDNRRKNLRLSNAQTNAANMHARWGSSNYKGVYFDVRLRKWAAGIRVDGVHIHIGLFDEEDDAAIAYDKEALNRFGAFARTNAPRKLYAVLDAALKE